MASRRLKRRLAGGRFLVPGEPTGATTVFAAPLPTKLPKEGLGLAPNLGLADLSLPPTPSFTNVLNLSPEAGGGGVGASGGGGGIGDISALANAGEFNLPDFDFDSDSCPPGLHRDEFSGTCVPNISPNVPEPEDGQRPKRPDDPCPPGFHQEEFSGTCVPDIPTGIPPLGGEEDDGGLSEAFKPISDFFTSIFTAGGDAASTTSAIPGLAGVFNTPFFTSGAAGPVSFVGGKILEALITNLTGQKAKDAQQFANLTRTRNLAGRVFDELSIPFDPIKEVGVKGPTNQELAFGPDSSDLGRRVSAAVLPLLSSLRGGQGDNLQGSLIANLEGLPKAQQNKLLKRFLQNNVGAESLAPGSTGGSNILNDFREGIGPEGFDFLGFDEDSSDVGGITKVEQNIILENELKKIIGHPALSKEELEDAIRDATEFEAE